ncbi:hypothetical protein ACX40Y_14375 [Sphingomonas sp. RS6]
MSIERLLRQHTHILSALVAVERAIDSQTASALDLRASRWRLARELLLHLAQVETGLYAPMRLDPEAREIAEAEIDATRTLAQQFAAHAQQWHSAPAPSAWNDYSTAFATLARRVRARIDAEARFIARHYPLDARLPGTGSPSSDLARIAWDIRRLIHGEDDKAVFS